MSVTLVSSILLQILLEQLAVFNLIVNQNVKEEKLMSKDCFDSSCYM